MKEMIFRLKYEFINSWIAYGQFCSHFIAPLAMAAHSDIRTLGLWRNYIDGFPLDLAANLLPLRRKYLSRLFMHLTLHARFQNTVDRKEKISNQKRQHQTKVSEKGRIGLIRSLRKTVQGISYNPTSRIWMDYDAIRTYGSEDISQKSEICSNGRSMFEIDPQEQRERKFFYYEWQHKNWQDEYLERIDEFIIKGSVFDLDSWQYNLAYFSPQNNQSDKSSIDIPVNGLTFDIGSSDEGLLELKGFSVKETDSDNSCYFRWAIGKNSRMIFNGLRLPKRSRVSVTFDVEPFIVNINKKMIIKSKLSTAEVVLKPGLSKYDVIVEFPEGEAPILNIYYDDAASPKSLAMNKDTRILSVKWNKIKLHYESKHQ